MAQWNDCCVPGLKLRDTIRVPGISGTRFRDIIVSFVVSMSRHDHVRNFRDMISGTRIELCCLGTRLGKCACPSTDHVMAPMVSLVDILTLGDTFSDTIGCQDCVVAPIRLFHYPNSSKICTNI